jgi:hypothetical protein
MTNYPAELPHGFYHRRVVVIVEPGRVRAAMEDESHCMEVTVTHDGAKVTDIQPASPRIPWTSCPDAGAKLNALIGLPLQRMHETTGEDAKQHCTHLFDLTRLAIARAKAGASVQYDIAVEDRVDDRTRGDLHRNGQLLLTWHLQGPDVTGPDPYTGHRITGAPHWPGELDADTIEAALVMRRVFLVSGIRSPRASRIRVDPANKVHPTSAERINMRGYCYTFQASNSIGATPHNNWIDFANRRDELLAHFPGVRTLAQMQNAG